MTRPRPRPAPKEIRLPSASAGDRIGIVPNIVASIEHGYLWIGGQDGPCLLHVSGKQTLRTLGKMLLRHSR